MTSWLDPATPLPPEPVRRRVPFDVDTPFWLDGLDAVAVAVGFDGGGGEPVFVATTPDGVTSVWLDVRRSYEDLQRQLADDVASLWDWSPPWSPSQEVLDEIRRQAGAPIEDRGWAVETSNAEDDDTWLWERIVHADVQRRTERWGSTWAKVLDEAYVTRRFVDPPPVHTAEWMVEWMRRYLDVELVDWQRALFESASRPQSVDTREVRREPGRRNERRRGDD